MTRKNALPAIASEDDFRKAIKQLKKIRIAKYAPSLVALIGSDKMVEQLFEQIRVAIKKKTIDGKLRERLSNLLERFIPQIAELNSVNNLSEPPTRKEIASLFKNSNQEKMLLGENKVFLRLIYGSLKNILETVPG